MPGSEIKFNLPLKYNGLKVRVYSLIKKYDGIPFIYTDDDVTTFTVDFKRQADSKAFMDELTIFIPDIVKY